MSSPIPSAPPSSQRVPTSSSPSHNKYRHGNSIPHPRLDDASLPKPGTVSCLLQRYEKLAIPPDGPANDIMTYDSTRENKNSADILPPALFPFPAVSVGQGANADQDGAIHIDPPSNPPPYPVSTHAREEETGNTTQQPLRFPNLMNHAVDILCRSPGSSPVAVTISVVFLATCVVAAFETVLSGEWWGDGKRGRRM